MNQGGVSPQRQVWVADLHTVDMSVCSFPKGKLGLPDVKAPAFTFKKVDDPKGLAVRKVSGFEDLIVG